MNNTSLRTSITKMLHEEFPDCDIYKDKQEAGTKLPAFYVRYVNVTQQGKGMDFYEQNYIVEVRHRPDPDMPPNEINDYLELTGGQITDLLSVVKDKDTGFSCRALNTESNISDGVLLVIANYQILRKRITESPEPYMNDLEENRKVR